MIGVRIEAELKRQALEPNPRHGGLEMIHIFFHIFYVMVYFRTLQGHPLTKQFKE